MPLERTLSIIKPDAVAKSLVGEIYIHFAQAGFRIVAAKLFRLSEKQAADFYNVHRDRPFFFDLVTFMSSGPIMVQILEGEHVVERYRALMGATNPAEAKAGSLRQLYAESIDHNAVHGSDSLGSARDEIAFFFTDNEIYA